MSESIIFNTLRANYQLFFIKQNQDMSMMQKIKPIDQTEENPIIAQMKAKIQEETGYNLDVQTVLNQFLENNKVDASWFEYNGKSIKDLSQEEAQSLVSDNGYFGVQQTSKRISDFVLNNAGDNLDRLQIAKQAIQVGLESAEKFWGGHLQDISYDTIDKVFETLDERIRELGGSVIDIDA